MRLSCLEAKQLLVISPSSFSFSIGSLSFSKNISAMEAALGFVVLKLGQLIQNETALVFNFKQDFKWLKMRLTLLTDALQFADGNDTHSEAVQQWIEDVRNTLWDAQDILDEYSLHTLCSCNYPQLISFRYKMGRKIREIKERMKSIMEIANDLRLIRKVASFETATSSSTVQPEGKWKKSSMMEYDSFPVSVDIKVQDIIERLHDPAVNVLALVGMGGIGKTFLLQHVFDKVKHMFDDSVWLSVSQTYSFKQLQLDLAYDLDLKDLATSGVSCTKAADIIYGCLKEKRSLIVLDDVWSATEENDLLRHLGIPVAVKKNGCKVIVTSRNKEVFSHLHPFIYQMPFLSADDSWTLFCAHAFPNAHENSPPAQRQTLAREIEVECGRLPLAVKTVASSLAKATTSTEWKSKLQQLKEVRQVNSQDPILEILKLSYYWLPSFLKPCFVYLSFFPEDKIIDCEYMVNLWIAEGFIPQTEDQVDTAWDYLRQLSNLFLVDVLKPDPCKTFFTGVLYHNCKVHDLVLDLAICISKENKSAFSAEEASRKSGCRRILLAKKGIDDKTIGNLCCAEVVRTLSLSQNYISNNIPPRMLSCARVVRVLDLGDTGISTLPECIGGLKLLRILNLSGTKLEQVPQCVRKLKNLSFLDVSMCEGLCRLPLWIGELVSLQHLNIAATSPEVVSHIPKGLSKLLSLRTLRSLHPLELSVEDDEYLRLEDVANMTCLQEIRIKVQNEVEMRSLAQGILGRLVKMRTLQLNCEMQGFGQIPLFESIKAMMDLQKLTLYGNFAVPGWIRGFENLRVLHFNGCDCSDLYPALETMGNLSTLILRNDEKCREFPKAFGKRGGFPNLRALSINYLQALEELPEMEDGGMASLESLVVDNCGRVRNVPRGFQGLERLRELVFVGCGTDEDRARLKQEWSRVQVNNPHLSLDIS